MSLAVAPALRVTLSALLACLLASPKTPGFSDASPASSPLSRFSVSATALGIPVDVIRCAAVGSVGGGAGNGSAPGSRGGSAGRYGVAPLPMESVAAVAPEGDSGAEAYYDYTGY